VFVKDPDGNMVEFIGPSKKAGARVMEPTGPTADGRHGCSSSGWTWPTTTRRPSTRSTTPSTFQPARGARRAAGCALRQPSPVEPRYLAAYELDSPAVQQSAAFKAAGEAGRWPGAVRRTR